MIFGAGMMMGGQAAGGASWQDSFDAIYDPSDLSSLFQNSDGTGAVTTDGDPVGYIADQTGNGYHLIQATSGSRGTYRTGGGLHWIELDGTADYLETASFTSPGATALTLVGSWERTGGGTGTSSFQSIIGAHDNGTQNCRNLYLSSITIHGANLMSGNTHVQAAVNPGLSTVKNTIVGEFTGVNGSFTARVGATTNTNTNGTTSTGNPVRIAVGRSRAFTERPQGYFYGGAVAFSAVGSTDRDAAVAFFNGKAGL